MKERFLFAAAILGLALGVGSAPLARAQDTPALTKKEAKQLLKESQKSLEEARKAARQGDGDAAASHAARHSESLERLNRALARGQVREEHSMEVAARVDEATAKHLSVLEEISTRFQCGTPEAHAGCHGIERALEASRHGHDTATQAILRHGPVNLPGGVLTDRAARGAMERNEALLRHAERARQRGDQAAVRRSVEQFSANMAVVGRAIEQGAVEESEAVSVLDRVDRSTRRHISVLEDLLGRVPEPARPGIERALQASRHGHQAATAALARTPAADVRAGRPGASGRPEDRGGRSGSTGGGQPGGGPPASPPGRGGRPR